MGEELAAQQEGRDCQTIVSTPGRPRVQPYDFEEQKQRLILSNLTSADCNLECTKMSDGLLISCFSIST